jgi:hypothetical protein
MHFVPPIRRDNAKEKINFIRRQYEPLGKGMLMASANENLARLAGAFTVRDIMVRTGELVCATVESDAQLLSKSYSDFSTIPIKTENRLSAYYSRDSGLVSPIEIQDLVSDGTGILDLVDILERREFAFVLGPRQIDGYIHFSDLNHDLVKLAFYVVLQGVERCALDLVKARLNDDLLEAALGAARFAQIQNSYRRAGDAGRSPVNYLNIADMLRLARRAGKLEIEDSMIQAIKDARDGAAHVLENLVSDYADVKKLAEVKRHSLRILHSSDGRQLHYIGGA